MITIDAIQFPRMQRQALARLADEVSSGRLRPGHPLGSEVTLAERLAVSRNTVRSMVQSLEAAGAVRQVPRRGIFLAEAFGLASAASEAVAVGRCLQIRWCDSLMEAEISTGLGDFAREHDIMLTTLNVSQSASMVIDILDHAAAGDWVVMIPNEHGGIPDAMRRALSRGVRLLQLDRYIDGVNAPAIYFDNYAGAVMATRHLLERAEGPVWFFGYLHPVSAHQRHAGWRDSMREYGFHDIDRYDICCGGERLDVEQQKEEFFLDPLRNFFQKRRHERMAFFCMIDSMAAMLYRVAAEFGLEVGRDLIVAGFGDEARPFEPALTTVRANQKLLAKAAGECLRSWPGIAGYRQVLPVELLVRDSSCFSALPAIHEIV